MRRFYVHFFYVILWEGNVELNINQTYQCLVYYDHEKINIRFVSYAIDSSVTVLTVLSTLNSYRLDTLGKVTVGISAEPSLLCRTRIKPLNITGTAVD